MPLPSNTKILLILDLDETLIHATPIALSTSPDFKVWKYYVYKRPYLDAFLEQVNQWFKLAIWSSASDDYVLEMVKNIQPKGIEFQFIWGRNRCTLGLKPDLEDDFSRHTYNNYTHYKNLQKVKRLGYSLDKTLIVDDTPLKVYHNYGNAIYPKPFEGNPNDDELLLLAKYLKTLKDVQNVRTLDKRLWRSNI